MDDYITDELPRVVDTLFTVDNSRKGIFGHSMGGHGAMALHLRNPGMYKSVSAFSPVCNPSNCFSGQKAFKRFLGTVEAGAEYDSSLLVAKYDGPKVPILIDGGTADQYKNQLKTEDFRVACGKANYPLIVRD